MFTTLMRFIIVRKYYNYYYPLAKLQCSYDKVKIAGRCNNTALLLMMVYYTNSFY